MSNNNTSQNEDASQCSESVQLLDIYKSTAKGDYQTGDSYKGIPIHALAGLHGHLMELLKQHTPLSASAETSALDLGAGAGALSLRLSDAGFHVIAVDAVEENFRPSSDSIQLMIADLNNNFAKNIEQHFELVTAVEIIEHLENPRNFLRNCKKLLKPNGILLLTTPNISSTYSITELALKDSFSFFDDSQYHHGGHICPISHWQILKMAEENQLSLLHESCFGLNTIELRTWPRFFLIFNLLQLLRPREKARNGAISIYIFQKQP